MKKLIIILSILLIPLTYAKDYTSMCSTNHAKKTLSGAIFSTIGVNFMARNIIEHVLKNELDKQTNAKFDVKLDTFYSTNIKNGEFKSLSAKTKQALIEGVYFSDIEAQTICNYHKVTYKNDTVVYNENLILKYKANITQDDVNKISDSNKYKKIINKTINSRTLIANYRTFMPVLNNLSYPFKLDENNKGKLDIENMQIQKGKMELTGYITIYKTK